MHSYSAGSNCCPDWDKSLFLRSVRASLIWVALPVDAPLEKTASVVERIETVASDQPAVERMATTVGTDQSASSSSDEGEHTAEITLKLFEGSTAEAENQLISQLRTLLADIPEVALEVFLIRRYSASKRRSKLKVRGNDLRQLRRLSKDVEARLSSIPGLVDVRSSLQAWQSRITDQLSARSPCKLWFCA